MDMVELGVTGGGEEEGLERQKGGWGAVVAVADCLAGSGGEERGYQKGEGEDIGVEGEEVGRKRSRGPRRVYGIDLKGHWE